MKTPEQFFFFYQNIFQQTSLFPRQLSATALVRSADSSAFLTAHVVTGLTFCHLRYIFKVTL